MLIALLCGLWLPGMAQAQASPAAAQEAERLAWTALRGNAIDLTVGADGTAFTLDPEGQVWMRRPGPASSWLSLPGRFRRIDAASERLAWALDAEGRVRRYNGSYWQAVDAPPALDVGVGPAGTVYLVTQEGALLRWAGQPGFVPVPGAPARVARVDVDDRELPWLVLRDTTVQHHDGRDWVTLPGRAHDVSAGTRGSAFVVGATGQPLRWNPALRSWTPLLAMASLVATGPGNKPWIATPDGAIFTNDTGVPDQATRQAPSTSVFSRGYAWRRLPSLAKSLSLSARGQAWALGPDGTVWRWRGRGEWQRLPGNFARIAAGPADLAMAVDAQGRIYSWRASRWTEEPGRALDVALTPQGVAWVLLPDGSPAYWSPQAGQWRSLNLPGPAARLAVGSSNVPWVLTRDGQVLSLREGAWEAHDGVTAIDLAVGPDGGVFVVRQDRTPARLDPLSQRWEPILTEAVAIAVGPRDQPWVVNTRGEIHASSLFEEEPAASGECSAAVGSRLPDFRLPDWRQLQGAAARQLAIGKDGNVMAVDTDSQLAQWRNQSQRFRSFPGQMARVAVAPDGKPWGVTARGEVWRHDGSRWLLVRSLFTARDVAVACNGTVMVAASDELLYRYNAAQDGFERVLPPSLNDPVPRGSRLALDPTGRPWVLREDWVYRCDVTPCERQALRAREIAIGPEGTVLAVDLEGNLQFFNGRDNRWERTGIAGAMAVAVGPGGKPWIVRNGTEVWATAFFDRKEDRDDVIAAATPATPVNSSSPAPVFTFSTTTVFDEVDYPDGLGGMANPHYLAIGPSGKVMVVRRMGSDTFLSYDTNRRVFVHAGQVMPPGGEVDGFALGLNDSLWAWVHPVNGSVNGRIWTWRNAAWQAVGGIAAMGLGDVPLPPFTRRPIELSAMATDGTVYAMGPDTGPVGAQDSTLYRYLPGSSLFTVAGMQLPGNEDALAVEPAGAVWLVRADTAAPYRRRVFQYVNNTFFERAPPPGVSLCPTPAPPDNPLPGCIATGANGSVFAIALQGSPRLLRWSAASQQWDVVVTSPTFTNIRQVAVASDGRPWIIATTDGTNYRVYKAR